MRPGPATLALAALFVCACTSTRGDALRRGETLQENQE